MSSEHDNDVPASNTSTGPDEITTEEITTDETVADETVAEPAPGDEPQRSRNIGDLGDIGHPFDQTNGIVEGLDGDADDPETYNKREEDDSFVAGAPGVGGVAGAGVVGTDREHSERDPDA